MSVLALTLPGCLISVMGAAAAGPVPVILDTDIGGDIDDTWALCILLGCPQVDLKLVVTTTDNTEAKTRLVAKILERVGRTDVPIGTGIKENDRPLNQAQWVGDYSLDDYAGTVHQDGVQAMIDMLEAAEEPVTLLVIGPQTNIRAALEREPDIAQKADVVTMAGSVHTGYNGKPGRCPEYNVRRDVEAAQAVFAAPWDITMAPLDSCGVLRLKGKRYKRVAESDNPRAKVVIENYRIWTNRRHYPEGESSVLFDTVAAYLTFADAHFKMETVKLVVDDEGCTVPDDAGRPVRCAMDWKDREAFEELLVESLTTRAEK